MLPDAVLKRILAPQGTQLPGTPGQAPSVGGGESFAAVERREDLTADLAAQAGTEIAGTGRQTGGVREPAQAAGAGGGKPCPQTFGFQVSWQVLDSGGMADERGSAAGSH